MRALILHGPDDVRLDDIPCPEPGPGELVIRIAVALTCATDRKILARGFHPSIGPVPAPFGHEGAGTVVAVGAGRGGFAPGDRVVPANSAPCGACEWCLAGRAGLCEDIAYLSGTYAEYLRIPAPIARVNVLPVPDGLDWGLAALAEPVACGVRGAERSRVRPNEQVIILGGGLQGQVLCAVLARRGCRVVVCDPHPERRELALRMGAEETGDAPRDADTLTRLRSRTPGGYGAHATFAAVGTVAVWEQAVALTRPGGEVNLHGGPAPGEILAVPAERLHYEELTLQSSYHHTPATFRAALEMINADRDLFRGLLGDEIRLEDVADALVVGGPKRIVHPGPRRH